MSILPSRFHVALLAGVFVALSGTALFAQEEDDLEIPAAPASATTAAPVPSTVPAASSSGEPAAAATSTAATATSTAAPSSPPVQAHAAAAAATTAASSMASAPPSSVATSTTTQDATLTSAKAKEPGTASKPATAQEHPIELAPSAHSRRIPKGLVTGGFVQAQYQRNQISEDQLQQDGTPLNRDEFVLRTARLDIDGGSDYVGYTLELDATTLDGARVGVRQVEGLVFYRGSNDEDATPLLGLAAGVIDIPFGYEVAESSDVRLFMERTVASEALFPTPMDVGAKLFGAWRFLRYAVGFVNGEPLKGDAPPHDPNAYKDIVGRIGALTSLHDIVVVAGGASFSFGKGFHPGRLAQKDTVAWRDDNEDGVANPNEIIGVPGAAATPSANFKRWVLGLDLQFALATRLGATRLFAEAYAASNHDRGLFLSDPVATGFDLRQFGAAVALIQEITPYGLIGFRASSYDPNADFLEQRRGDFVPRSQDIRAYSPLIGLVLPEQARLLFQYDLVRDQNARDRVGVPTDAKNDQLTVRLQVEL